MDIAPLKEANVYFVYQELQPLVGDCARIAQRALEIRLPLLGTARPALQDPTHWKEEYARNVQWVKSQPPALLVAIANRDILLLLAASANHVPLVILPMKEVFVLNAPRVIIQTKGQSVSHVLRVIVAMKDHLHVTPAVLVNPQEKEECALISAKMERFTSKH